jgi:predicted dehydrogenase
MGQLYELPVRHVPRFLVIGVGPHAKRTYIPHLLDLERRGRADLVAVVDIEPNRDVTLEYTRKHCPGVDLVLVPFFTTRMPDEVTRQLNSLSRHLKITHVIIATEPQAHRAYGLWALNRELHIIMDKPLTARRNAAHSEVQAMGIAQDYLDLVRESNALALHVHFSHPSQTTNT